MSTLSSINIDEQQNSEIDDENSKLVSVDAAETDHQQQQHASTPRLRSILRKRAGTTTSTDGGSDSQQASIRGDQCVAADVDVDDDDDERDSDYTADENDEESNGSSRTAAQESKNNEQKQRHHQHCNNYSRSQPKDQLCRTSPTPSLDSPLGAADRAEAGIIEIEPATSPSSTFSDNDSSLTRTACVTFTREQPNVNRRSSSTSRLSGPEFQPRSSITYVNMKDDLSVTMPITTTTGSSSTLGAEFRPVYVSPLKYRPLVGLSANDSRLLLEKRVSLLGKPLVLHPIQKRSPSYRRTQLHIYNFLERPHGCKAVIYHTFV